MHPHPQLDLVYSQGIGQHWKLKFKARNPLDPDVKLTQGPETTRIYQVGRVFEIGFEWVPF